MSAFLTDTLVWTGVLIGGVLVARGPVAHWFGARAAYGLWALPMARLLLPPLVLPSWMAPAAEEAAFVAGSPTMAPADPAGATAPTMPSAALQPGPATLFDWTALLMTAWLVGAGVVLVRRYALYFRMRRELLADARPVGRAGTVRFVETPAADGPVAFGVFDRVVALPAGFMADRDIESRDLALAHELAHHRGQDLLCNMLAQPLFALHWFNPLGRIGWQALRRDQEAACDERVVGAAPRERRAAYAAVIARYATRAPVSPRLALAAPIACPGLGDRSIVHRLRTISMSDHSTRRRWAGRLVLAAGVLALPLTASVSYAQAEAPPPPPEPPVAPLPPEAAEAPLPPRAPEAPTVTEATASPHRVIRVERHVTGDDAAGKDRKKRVVIRRLDGMSAEDRAELAREMAEFDREMAQEKEELRLELEKEFGKHGKMRREIRIAMADAHNAGPRVRVACREGQSEVAESLKGKDGREELWICQAAAIAEARKGLAEARAELAREKEMSATSRAEALRSIDEAEKALRAN